MANEVEGAYLFQLPSVPDTLTAPHDRADYVCQHFWDYADFDDQRLSEDKEALQQAFVDFIFFTGYASSDSIRSKALSQLVDKTRPYKPVTQEISELARKYLYETESPMLNEGLYAMYLGCIIANDSLSAAERLRYEYLLEQISRNQPGTIGYDLLLTDHNGVESTLSALADRRNVILLFYDHDCESCSETIEEMLSDRQLVSALIDGTLCVIAVDVAPGGSPIKRQMPNWYWTSAIDDAEEHYSIRSYPSVYILAPDLTVMVKDSTFAVAKHTLLGD